MATFFGDLNKNAKHLPYILAYKSNCNFRAQILSKIGNPCISRSSSYVPPLGAQNEGALCSDYRIRDLDLARCVCVCGVCGGDEC